MVGPKDENNIIPPNLPPSDPIATLENYKQCSIEDAPVQVVECVKKLREFSEEHEM